MAERGSTLPEVLVALAVLGIGLVGSAQLLLLGLATESRAALREGATLRLADAAELAWAWSGIPPPARVADWQAAAGALRPDAPQSVSATLEPWPAEGSGLVSLRASVRWGDAAVDATTLRAVAWPDAGSMATTMPPAPI